MHRFRVHGARGSWPAAGEDFQKFPGSTSSYSLETERGIIIFDAGTGITALGNELVQRSPIPPIDILLTHFHLDHVSGLPSFKPIYMQDARITIHADMARPGWPDVLRRLVSKPLWPIELERAGASIRFENLPTLREGVRIQNRMKAGRDLPAELHVGNLHNIYDTKRSVDIQGVKISCCPVWHPQTCLSYRIVLPDKVIVLGTDREHGMKDLDRLFFKFCKGADVLLHDAQFTPEDYAAHEGWGHSTWEVGVNLARELKVSEFILVHHAPDRRDNEIDAIVRKARRIFPSTYAATQNMVLA
jgi:ribonuclease BN (tRNA processing enzyme)